MIKAMTPPQRMPAVINRKSRTEFRLFPLFKPMSRRWQVCLCQTAERCVALGMPAGFQAGSVFSAAAQVAETMQFLTWVMSNPDAAPVKVMAFMEAAEQFGRYN